MRHKPIVAILLLLCVGSIHALTGYGESNTFAISEESLPVELSSFSATVTANNYVQLSWITQSETNLLGYFVYRNTSAELSYASSVSGLIQPSNSSCQQSYSYLDSSILDSGQYYYWLLVLEMDGTSFFHNPISVLVNMEGGGPGIPEIPLATGLKSIYPNPFNPSTLISYQIASPEAVSLSIFNARGQLVKNFSRSHSAAGVYSVVFDAQDSRGRDAASGVYLVIMKAGKHISRRKIVLLK